jgi:hypothetical protein
VGSEADGGWFDGVGLTLTSQIKLPQKKPIFQNVNVKENYSPVFASLKKRGWVQGRETPHSKVNMFFTRGNVVFGLDGKRQIQNTIGLSGCMGGNKQLQVRGSEHARTRSEFGFGLAQGFRPSLCARQGY